MPESTISYVSQVAGHTQYIHVTRKAKSEDLPWEIKEEQQAMEVACPQARAAHCWPAGLPSDHHSHSTDKH